jgi:hypothetical protein
MKPGDYRREYAAYCAALARARYEFHVGRASALQLAPVNERYADLWARERLDELEQAHRDTPAQFETERTALRRLLNVARFGYIAAQTREVAAELAHCESSVQIAWHDARFCVTDVPVLIAKEPDAARRRELSARWRDALQACDDLRAAQLNALNTTAATLGCTSYFALLDEATQTDKQKTTAAAEALLARTNDAYRAHLHMWAMQHLPLAQARAPVYADSLFFARLAPFDQFFAARDLMQAYHSAMAALGIRIERQANLRVEWSAESAPPQSAQLIEQSARMIEPTCFALAPPMDVRLVVRVHDGAATYRAFWQAAGCAQQLAWVSRDMAERYPEFVLGPDATTRAAYGFLFCSLLHDPAWLNAHLGLKASAAAAVAQAFALVELHDVRRCCAQLLYEQTLATAADPRAENLAVAFAATLTEATGFAYDPALHLWASTKHLSTTRAASCSQMILPPAPALRARLFAAALGEHLRTRHGLRWWATRAAGDELIDLWNTGARYTVEELSALGGAGALDADVLADSLLRIPGE